MNIEDGERAVQREQQASVDSRLPLWGGGEVRGARYSGWRSDRVVVAMVVAPANTPVMTGQTEICITLGEARLARPSPSPSPSFVLHPFARPSERASLGLRQTAELSRLRVGPGIPSCN